MRCSPRWSWWVWGATAGVLAGCGDSDHPPYVVKDGGGVLLPNDPADASLSAFAPAKDSSVEAKSDAPGDAVPPEAGSTDAGPSAAPPCSVARSSSNLSARLAATSVNAAPAERVVFVSDLFGLFRSSCGGCHVETGLGGFQTGPSDFPDKVGQVQVDRILSTDPAATMPPLAAGGKLASTRNSGDPILELVSLLESWIAAGRPRDVFYLPADNDGGASQYLLSNAAAARMTNLGDCVPSARIVGTQAKSMADMDAFFASLTRTALGEGTAAERLGLPERLDQTDLFTLDAETLARHGVIAYVPTYPLWTDDAGKLRHVRVPRGQTIKFDRNTQRFEIPENTRFYKTFMKSVVDADGVVRWRKVETRVIVARGNKKNGNGGFEDGKGAVNALYGTYAWNDDESEATLVTDPLRDGEPFRDRLITYVTNEPAAEKITAQKSKDLQIALQKAGLLRRYAIPGSERCLNCHQGSPDRSFILGFLPVQIKRRPLGEGGVIEPAGPDELTQLERLIEYGVISGVTSSEDIASLEETQGTRKPRNDKELIAQGYLLGNCAHCHNPHGQPSVENPVLQDVFDLLPSSSGGIFQFPLDRMSPRITRGLGGQTPIPYITPSLLDLPPTGDGAHAIRKYNFSYTPAYWILAPWRSLVYRNVDTPFTYAEDLALFPHMPRDSPGFDCRAPRILADWMVSIPATRSNSTIPEYNLPELQGQFVDTSPQPYVEVKPGERGYDAAVKDAEERLAAYHVNSPPYGQPTLFPPRPLFCPNTSDIVDPAVLADPEHRPVPIDEPNGIWSGSPPGLVMPSDGVPDRPHWVVSDITQVPGAWNPRRTDWEQVLVRGVFPKVSSADTDAVQRQRDEKKVVAMLKNVHLTSAIRSFASQEIPLGLWKDKPSCDLSSTPTVASYGASRPAWMDEAKLSADSQSHVYTVVPGAAVFSMICINCHGKKADSAGRQAENLNAMTGGNARVADLRDGLFGPTDQPGANRRRVFGDAASDSTSYDEWGARYLAWMGLGGTQRTIPASILAIVANSQVLGTPRTWSNPPSDANMLSTAQNLCKQTLPIAPDPQVIGDKYVFDAIAGAAGTSLIRTNGDAELWRRLCSLDNRPPLRAVWAKWDSALPQFLLRTMYDYYPSSSYPQDQPVGAPRGHVATGITDDNTAPWCIRKPVSASKLALATAWAQGQSSVEGRPWPFCPDAVVPPTDEFPADDDGHMTSEALHAWGTRGAINAGLAVFLYLDGVVKGTLKPKPQYDECELTVP